MANFSVQFDRMQSAIAEEDQVVSRLASLSERLSSVSQALSGNSTTAKYCGSVKKAAQETEDHRQYVKNLETVLTEICTTYQNTDKKAGQALASQTAGGASISFRKEENTTSSTAGTGAEEGMDLLKEAVEGVKSNKENAKELLQQWKTFYDGLDEKEQKALDKAARKLFGDELMDSVELSGMIINGDEFKDIALKAKDVVIPGDTAYQKAVKETLDYVFDDETMSRKEAMEAKALEQLRDGDYLGVAGTIGYGFVDIVIRGSVEVVTSVVDSTLHISDTLETGGMVLDEVGSFAGGLFDWGK
ncbi:MULTISPECIES: hypothetical protein [Clostridia]|uniref:LXG domain-containing protein n=1 Tax=Faecalicatena fissicatena TaxID=290055 RepID=A0ABS2EAY7_9FIRM|nr:MULTISPECIES: hypothetical protein [Clostridia]MBM6738791.1 hypothetical protein [Faecalicatena fissicatena]HIX99434.1 hypothetical protein [Candidatus Dorea intestinigallinarum]